MQGTATSSGGYINGTTFIAQMCGTSSFSYTSINSDAAAVTGNVGQFLLESDLIVHGCTLTLENWDDRVDTAKLEAGAGVKVFNLNGKKIVGEFKLDLEANTLASGLMWDASNLYSTGVISVIWSAIADGSRIANTLWTSGQTVANISTEAVKHVGEAVTGKTTVWLSSLNDFTKANSAGSTTGYDFNTQGYSVGAQRGLEGGHVIGLAFGNSYGTHTPLQESTHASAGKIK